MTLTLSKLISRGHAAAFAATLYAAAVAGATHAVAEPDWTAIESLKSGQMKGLAIHGEAKDTSDLTFLTFADETADLSAFEGRVVVLNFWATWCGPCRHEMPGLDALQATLGSDNFSVELIATGPRNEHAKIEKFFDSVQIENLVSYRDPDGAFSRDMAILGLPITVILDPNGKEIARLRGDAEWNSPEAQAILTEIVKGYMAGET